MSNTTNCDLSVAATEKGFITGDLFLDWIEREFDARTKDKAKGEWRLLFLDGHSSHQTLRLIDFCRERKIIVMAFPPHTTHALQSMSYTL
jgi:hypothetical protein